ncbi:MAG: hypothetical protein LBR33_12840 [Propionibacteriaceae bacterium]|jgi:hypothetical protein|nr:hypothetical protein [Propionibacteriaceae bacterium]
MTAIDRDALRAGLAAAVAAQDPTLPGRLGRGDQAALDLVAIADALAREATQFLTAAVLAARQEDIAWARIGRELGVSRQAAQQRFTGAEPPNWAVYQSEVERPDEAWRLSPVTAATEMDELERLGKQGWHSVGFGPGYHDVVPSDQQWQHKRTTVFGHQPQKKEGWQRIGMWFPFVYYTRPTDKAAVKE